jgi:hypothetical protein
VIHADKQLFECRRILLHSLPAAFTCTAILFLAGCIPTIEYGSRVDVAELDKLTVRQSGKPDVLLALGEPRGKGGAEFVKQQGQPREIWFYEYTRTDGKTIKLLILIIFYLDDVYDGYWWFSSIEEFYCSANYFTGRLNCPDEEAK